MSEHFGGAPSPDPEKFIPPIGPDEAAELLDKRPLREKLIEERGPNAPIAAYHQEVFRLLQSRQRMLESYKNQCEEIGHLVEALGRVYDEWDSLSAEERSLAERYNIKTRDQGLVLELALEQKINHTTEEIERMQKEKAEVLADRYEVVKKYGPPEEMIPNDLTEANAFASSYFTPEPAKPRAAAEYEKQERHEYADLLNRYHDTLVQLGRMNEQEKRLRHDLAALSLLRRADWKRIGVIRRNIDHIKATKKSLSTILKGIREEMRHRGVEPPEPNE